MTIDILLATFNGGKYLEAQILSIISQSYKEWNLIIHDDGSIDNTINIINKWSLIDPRIRLIDDGHRCGGPGQNFFYLLKFSNSDYVMFADQDDIWFDNKIAYHFQAIKNRNNQIPQVVYSNSYVWIENEGIKGLATLTFPKNINQFLFLNSGMQGCVAIFNKAMRDVLVSFNGKLAMHDHILHLAGLCLGEVEYLPVCLMLYRNHYNNVTGETAIKSIDVKKIIKNKALPVVDINHYEAVLDFYNFYNFQIEGDVKLTLQSYFKMIDMNFGGRLLMIIKSDFQLFNSRFRLIVKLLLRPYINNLC